MLIKTITVENITYDIGADYTNLDNTPNLSAVATSGSYGDLSNKPNIPTKTSDLVNDSGFINKNVNDLTNYTLSSDATSQLELILNSENYKLKGVLKDENGNIIYTSNEIDFPLESVVVSGSYDSQTKEVVLTLVNGSTIRFSVADLVSGLVSQTDLNTALANYYTKNEVNGLLANKQDIVQYSTMPTASESLLGKIVQYVGTTDSTYTNGYFYIGTTDGQSTPTYSWKNLQVQAEGGTKIFYITQMNRNATMIAEIQAWYDEWQASGVVPAFEVKGINANGFAGLKLDKSSVETNTSSTVFRLFFYNITTASNLSACYYTYNTLRFDIKNGRVDETSFIEWKSQQPYLNKAYFVGAFNMLNNNTNIPMALSTKNTDTYTPKGDYHPATKKYVDDSIASAITTALESEY